MSNNMNVTRHAKFVSRKVNKIRWKPKTKRLLNESNVFASGSWDNGVANTVSLWSLESSSSEPSSNSGEFTALPCPDIEPRLLCEYVHPGDVTDLQFIKGDLILASSSDGSLILYRHHAVSQTLSPHQTWTGLHQLSGKPCSCTGIAYKSDDSVVTVGENGTINLLHLEQKTPVRVIENADSCTPTAVTHLKQFEVATVNNIGQLKVWDVRQPTNEPAKLFVLSGKQVPLHCLDKHPTQPHVLATAGEDNTVSIWDMRQDRFPVTLLTAHTSDVWEVQFHSIYPDNLFTCSQDGSVWHWNAANMTTTPSILSKGSKSSQPLSMSLNLAGPPQNDHPNSSLSSNPWLSVDASANRLEVNDLVPGNTLPVNTLDIVNDVLLCGTDGEQIYYISDLGLQ